MDLLDKVRQKSRNKNSPESNGAVPTLETESGDPVVGLAVRIVEINHLHIPEGLANIVRSDRELPAWAKAVVRATTRNLC